MLSKILSQTACFAAVLLAVSHIGCNPASERRLPNQYGVTETAVNRDIAEQAILLANLVLPPDQPLRLQPTWVPVGYFPVEEFKLDPHHNAFATSIFDEQVRPKIVFSNAEVIPVFLIDRESLGNIEVAFVPDGCRCVFVNARNIDELSEKFFLTGRSAFEQHGGFDQALALSLVFLHELGHLHFGDRGSYGLVAHLEVSEINKPSKLIYNAEVRADAFASEMVRLAWASGEMHSSLPGPYGRAEIASNIFRVMETGFNSYDLKNDPQGIMYGKKRYEVFRQEGYSHLNLYLRLLIFLEQSEPTAERLQYLKLIAQSTDSPVGSK